MATIKHARLRRRPRTRRPGESSGTPALLTRAERVRALRGKYAWIPFSSEDFIQEKHREIDAEDKKCHRS